MAKNKTSKKETARPANFYERARLQYENSRAKTRGTDFWKPSDKLERFRLIPFTHDGRTELVVETGKHWNCHTDPRIPITCLYPDRCALCDLEDSVPDTIWNGVRSHTGMSEGAIRPQNFFLANVFVFASDQGRDGAVRIGQLQSSVYNSILEITKIIGEAAFSLTAGYDMLVHQVRQGKKIVYRVDADQKKTAVVVSKASLVDLVEFVEKQKDPDLVDSAADRISAGIKRPRAK